MANTILTPTAVTREALRVLHQKLNFIGTITRDYDDSYAKQGAKIGDTLKIRLPNQYTVRTGATLSAQDTTESSVSLQLATQKGVDVNFTSNELTLSLDDFSTRIIQPAMAVLASNIEADAMSMYKDVYQQVSNTGAAITFNKVLQGRKILGDALTPQDDDRCANLNTQDNVDLVDALKGLFQDSGQISKQYREGMLGRIAGFDFYENTLWPSQTVGTKGGSPVVSGATQSGAALVTNGWTGTQAGALKKGDVFTIGLNKVHPESKNNTGVLQQFVVTADVTADGSGGASLAISPSIIVSGPLQNVVTNPTTGTALTIAGTSSTAYGISMAYHKNAFAFGTADLVMPDGVDFAARQTLDGISMRIVRQYDITNDKFPCRIDVLYG